MTRKTWKRHNYGMWIIDFYLCSTVSSLVVWTNEFLTNDTFHSSTHQLRIHVVCWIGANKSIFNWLKKHWTSARAISLPLFHLPASLSILTLYSHSCPIPPSYTLPHTLKTANTEMDVDDIDRYNMVFSRLSFHTYPIHLFVNIMMLLHWEAMQMDNGGTNTLYTQLVIATAKCHAESSKKNWKCHWN